MGEIARFKNGHARVETRVVKTLAYASLLCHVSISYVLTNPVTDCRSWLPRIGTLPNRSPVACKSGGEMNSALGRPPSTVRVPRHGVKTLACRKNAGGFFKHL